MPARQVQEILTISAEDLRKLKDAEQAPERYEAVFDEIYPEIPKIYGV